MRLPVLFAGSLLLNAALATWLLHHGHAESARCVAPASVAPVVPLPDPTDPLAGVDPHTWQVFTGGDLHELVGRLRAKGFPPHVIRAILTVQVQHQFADRYAKIVAAIRAEPYWMTRMSGSNNPRISRDTYQLQRDVRTAVNDLLGTSLDDTPANLRWLRRQYGDLSVAKLDQLQRIQADYDDMRAAARAEAHYILLPEDRDKLALLQREERADIERLLTPDEVLAMDLRSSGTANRLQAQLSSFHPTEDEYRRLFAIQQQFDDHFPTTNATPEQKRARTDAEPALQQKIAAALGADRYADYQRTTDPVWRHNDDFVSQFRLPDGTTAQLFAIEKDLSQRADALRAQHLPAVQLNDELTALVNEATVRLAPVLTPPLLAGYKERTEWLRRLQPQRSDGHGGSQ